MPRTQQARPLDCQSRKTQNKPASRWRMEAPPRSSYALTPALVPRRQMASIGVCPHGAWALPKTRPGQEPPAIFNWVYKGKNINSRG